MKRFAIGGMAALLLAWLVPVQALAGQPRVDICHWSEDDAVFLQINVAARAVDKHFAEHGDVFPESNGLDENCEPAAEAILAVAYSNLDGMDGYDPEGSDVLIAKLVDTNGDGVVSVGDTVMMGQYPKSFTPLVPADFGSFGIASHTVGAVGIAGSTYIVVESATAEFAFATNANGEQYFETPVGTVCDGCTELLDIKADTNYDKIFTNYFGTSPSQPDATLLLSRRLPGSGIDDAYLDVDILL